MRDKGIDTGFVELTDQIFGFAQFIVIENGVERDVDAGAIQMGKIANVAYVFDGVAGCGTRPRRRGLLYIWRPRRNEWLRKRFPHFWRDKAVLWISLESFLRLFDEVVCAIDTQLARSAQIGKGIGGTSVEQRRHTTIVIARPYDRRGSMLL